MRKRLSALFADTQQLKQIGQFLFVFLICSLRLGTWGGPIAMHAGSSAGVGSTMHWLLLLDKHGSCSRHASRKSIVIAAARQDARWGRLLQWRASRGSHLGGYSHIAKHILCRHAAIDGCSLLPAAGQAKGTRPLSLWRRPCAEVCQGQHAGGCSGK